MSTYYCHYYVPVTVLLDDLKLKSPFQMQLSALTLSPALVYVTSYNLWTKLYDMKNPVDF
jgi:hypothetical protein